MKIEFKLLTDISIPESIEICASLFSDESILFKCDDKSIRTISTPLAFVGIDRRLYSKNNWVGINPFVFVSGVDISLRMANGMTEIDVIINKKRTLVIDFLAIILFSMVAYAIHGKIKFIFMAVSILFFLMVHYFSGPLIRLEICKKINAKQRV